jgi:voltage-gated potassium channel Kch
MTGVAGPSEGAAPDEPGRFVVCGDNALARRLIRELMDRYQVRVTVVVRTLAAVPPAEIAELAPANGDPALRPVVVLAPRLTAEVFEQAGVGQAAALALVDQDDVANVDAALIARELNPAVRIVARMFNPVIGAGITTLGDCGALSASEIAAPAFVAAVLGVGTPTYVRLPDQFLRMTKRADVEDPDDILCGLAITGGGADPVTLPADEDAADIVLVRSYGSPPRQPRRQRRHPLRATRLLFGRNLRLVLITLLALLAIGTVTLAVVRRLDLWQAAYLTILGALGGANPDLDTPVAAQVVEILLAVTGVALVPALTAAVVEVVVKARLALAFGGLIEPVSDHVIVVGLGNLGTRMIQELDDLGLDVVAVDRSEDARGIQRARELGIPVILGDTTSAETLRAASVATCRALAVVAADDMTNLETALLGRALYQERRELEAGQRDGDDPAPALRVVLRLFDEDFAGRVTRAFGIGTSRSVSYLAAPAFAAAMLGREVIDTVSVGRRVLLIAELPVGAGSELEHRFCPVVSQPGQNRLLAVRTGRGEQTLWRPPARRKLVRTDRLLVVATRTGLADLLRRTAAAANPPPLPEPMPLRLLAIGSQHRDDTPPLSIPDADPAGEPP